MFVCPQENGLYFLVESDDFFEFVARHVDAGGRGTFWSMSSRTPGSMEAPLTASGVEGTWQCRLLAVRVSSPRTATSARTLVHVAQSVPQVGAVPNVKGEVFGTLMCHRV